MAVNCLSRLFLFIGGRNYQILHRKTNKIVWASSFLFLIITAFIPLASAQKAIILNFDDDWKGQFTYAVPILEKYGFKATFFVTTGCLTYQNSSFCNNAGGDSAMTWEDIRSLSELGHDIQSHGMSHKDLTTVIDMLAKYYDMARVGYEPLVYLDSTDRYSLPVWTDYDLQLMYKGNSTKIFDIFVETIDSQALYNTNGSINAIPIIVYHNVDYKNSTSNISPDWVDSTIDVNLFDSEMKYLHDNGFQVLTMSDLGYNQTSNKLYIKNNTDVSSLTR